MAISNLTATLISLIALSSFFPTSHGYILDTSCDSYYRIATAASDSFAHVHAALDLLENVADLIQNPRALTHKENIILTAQKDLIRYIFPSILQFDEEENGYFHSGKWMHVVRVLKKILLLDKNENGSPSPMPSQPEELRALGSEAVIFCDGKRFIPYDSDDYCGAGRPFAFPIVCDVVYKILYPSTNIMRECLTNPNSIVSHYTLIQTGLILFANSNRSMHIQVP